MEYNSTVLYWTIGGMAFVAVLITAGLIFFPQAMTAITTKMLDTLTNIKIPGA